MKKKAFNPVIRLKTSLTRRIIRQVFLLVIWSFIALVVLASLGFHLGWYSDDLVSLYLLFNLTIHSTSHLVLIMGGLLIIVVIYSIYRWRHLVRSEGTE